MKLDGLDFLDLSSHLSENEIMVQHSTRKFVDKEIIPIIDEHFEDKIKALYCHASQMSTSIDEGRVRLRNRFSVHGPKVNAEVAEAFKRLEFRS